MRGAGREEAAEELSATLDEQLGDTALAERLAQRRNAQAIAAQRHDNDLDSAILELAAACSSDLRGGHVDPPARPAEVLVA